MLVALAGCSRMWLEEREPWRHEAEESCLKSGAVKESAAVALLTPINGPGMCGADFPLKVSVLGDAATAMSYGDDVRPPGSIPLSRSAQAPYTPYRPEPYAPQPYQPRYGDDGSQAAGAPISLAAPGLARQPSDGPGDDGAPMRRRDAYPRATTSVYPPEDDEAAPGSRPGYPSQVAPRQAYPRQNAPSFPPVSSVPLGRREPALAAAGPANVTPPATLACPIVSALDRWIADAVQPAAQKWFGQPVTEIKQISAYSCRGMNGQPGAHISEHAFGNALDIASFTLADGRKVVVKGGWNGLPEEQGFLRDVQGAACDQFTTVLAPGSNAYHYDHIHVDLMRRASGRRICQPSAIPGEVAAERARSHYAGRRDYTGSIGSRRRASMSFTDADTDDDHEPQD